LKNYITTGKSSYYNKFLTYKKEFIALDIEGLNGWGEAPGDVMVVEKGGVQYFVIPGIKFGNIIILPEPQRGWEADSAKLYHCTSVAPTHQYLAVFAYLQQIGVDGMVYMGRHGTHEWLPGKEVVLSCDDFPSVVKGSVPQIYYYIVDGLAEGEQLKKRFCCNYQSFNTSKEFHQSLW
jgi:cobaltochelatase CobN